MDAARGFGHLRPELGKLSGFDRYALAHRGPGIFRSVMNEHLFEIGRLAGIQFMEGSLRLWGGHGGLGSAYQNASGRTHFVGHLPKIVEGRVVPSSD